MDEILETLKTEIFRNAVRLFRDACLLYSEGRYPSAYALAILAYEELGKLLYVDRICDAISLNPEGATESYGWLTNSPVFNNHRKKQEYAHVETSMEWPRGSRTKFIIDGGLDQAKQQALYVDFRHDAVLTPARITRQKAFSQLEEVFKACEACGETGFNGIDGYPSKKVAWLTSDQMAMVHSAFAKCERPEGRP